MIKLNLIIDTTSSPGHPDGVSVGMEAEGSTTNAREFQIARFLEKGMKDLLTQLAHHPAVIMSSLIEGPHVAQRFMNQRR